MLCVSSKEEEEAVLQPRRRKGEARSQSGEGGQATTSSTNLDGARVQVGSTEDNSCQLVTEESTSTRRWPAAFLRDNDKLNDTEARRDRMSSRSLCFLLGGQVEGKDRRGHCLTRSNVKARHSHLHQGVFYASVKRAY
ncbi:hypothetical protein HZU73_09094 [Apis mellifera caucasica]|uniref:Uncharacterized protein LOC113218659 n=1 Tax=Apis mellifera TaxID=7460 RepID=A0A7M7KZX3_APIME|nr:uncharacterized protein LOC113218659 [Apis mellifera]KAG6795705.1 hypothetical protein HZU73_09094 [Apis mellifera caucasica]KAG9433313.1 hypothetical protein HZU67_05282 [Apis mellifera carnica]|eukprot:XP_026295531.1 uncharacterized protein LOC113218659 [Apis mellifera]